MRSYERDHQVLISCEPSLLNTDVIIQFLRQSYWANKRPDQNIKRSLDIRYIGYTDAHGLYEQYGFVRDHGKTLIRKPDFLRTKS